MSEVAVVEGVPVDTRHWIGGQRVASSGTFTDISPVDDQLLGQMAAGGKAEADEAFAAVSAATRSLRGLR